MLIGQPYFTIEFLPYNGKFTVKRSIYSGGYNDIQIERNHLVFQNQSEVYCICEQLNSQIQNILNNE